MNSDAYSYYNYYQAYPSPVTVNNSLASDSTCSSNSSPYSCNTSVASSTSRPYSSYDNCASPYPYYNYQPYGTYNSGFSNGFNSYNYNMYNQSSPVPEQQAEYSKPTQLQVSCDEKLITNRNIYNELGM
jgi:hypothetical protein